jgi:replicative superfamily II helicase
MNLACYEKVSGLVKEGHQVMVFVHSRKDTVMTAQSLYEEARAASEAEIFENTSDEMRVANIEVQKSKNKELRELFGKGFGIHHAGMLRSDRTLSEKMFSKGYIKVLCCTATLAWGVNLPAYAVVIKGTQLYNAEKVYLTDC